MFVNWRRCADAHAPIDVPVAVTRSAQTHLSALLITATVSVYCCRALPFVAGVFMTSMKCDVPNTLRSQLHAVFNTRTSSTPCSMGKAVA